MVPQPYKKPLIQYHDHRSLMASQEALVQAIGREIWSAGDDLLLASAGIASFEGSDNKVRRYSPLSLAIASITLRGAADELMEGFWENAAKDFTLAAETLRDFVPFECFQGIVDSFSYYVPMPSSEWSDARDSLFSVADALDVTGSLILDEGSLPFRQQARAVVARAAESFRRAGRLFDVEEHFTPSDPRRCRCPAAVGFEEVYSGSLGSLRDEMLSMVDARGKAHGRIELIYMQLRLLAKRPGSRTARRSLLEELSHEYMCNAEPGSPGWDADRFLVFVFVQRLRGYDFGSVFPLVDRVKEQLRGIEKVSGRTNVWNQMLLEFEREFNPSRHPKESKESVLVYFYVQKLMKAAESPAEISEGSV